MQDRSFPLSRMPGGIAPCCYCAVGAGDVAPGSQWQPEQLVHLYVCRELSTYRIAAITGLDRQRVTRTLHRAGVMLRPGERAAPDRCGAPMTRPASRSS